ncbi:hypothetical protein [Marinobacter sp. CA1]|uniref:hypothetical protein n=1 Tax=Marinobacter sp. CA1 TaxID=2817656 RepID=UPI001D06CEE2|nr:hypothetical protein [Marinobacter sp. CA1]UDL03732.1 hypothetical protein J2887_13470 [Marinobacter sp. CA1]
MGVQFPARRYSPFVALLASLSIATSHAAPLVTPNPTVVAGDQPYYTLDVRNTRLIYTEQNQAFAARVAELQATLQPRYEASFGFSLGERLYVALASDYNQVANGFSTQFPVNRQVNYGGGALSVDRFATTSWLDTLIHHETAHNYQTNARNNPVSQGLYELLGVGALYTPVVPAITPNLFESSFILEGNAVLNESWHGNGGRLYNGRMKAMTLLQARAGQLTPERLYNEPLAFPYREAHYVFGGYYQYYLAERFGLDRTNRYFLNRSEYWHWPLLVNAPTRDTFGHSFNTLINDWSRTLANEAATMNLVSGPPLAHSQSAGYLNRNDNEVFFLAQPDGVRAPELVTINRNSGAVRKQRQSYALGKLIEHQGERYVQGSRHTSPNRIHQGLFDASAQLLAGTEGRIVQGYLSDGRAVYFDVPSSFSKPQLYVGDRFYREVNSSVLIGTDDALYYFVQDGRERTLYRNHEPLLSLDSYYGRLADIDSRGRIYFITNTRHGSGLFRTDGRQIEQVLAGDNVADARLLDDHNAVVMAVALDGYEYTRQPLRPVAGQPHTPKLFWDRQPVPETDNVAATSVTNGSNPGVEHRYHPLGNLHYQGTEIYLSTVSTRHRDGEDDDHWLYTLNAQFADPLTQNRLGVFALRDGDLSHLAGVSYTNSQYPVLAGVRGYGVLDEQLEDLDVPDDSRGFGVRAELRWPFLRNGYWYGEASGFHYLDYRKREREPTGGQLQVSRTEQFGHSFYPNSRSFIQGFAVNDRGDSVSGGALALATDFPAQFYAGVSGKYARSDASVDHGQRRGVFLDNAPDTLSDDPSLLVIPGLVGATYAREANYGEAHFAKVLNLDAYSFHFPLSLRREALSLRYRHVDTRDATRGGDVSFNQFGVGLTLELVAFNIAPIRVGVEYTRSDDTPMTDRDSVSALLQLGL